MHPGQYTVLNSPKKQVVDRAIEDLKYHSDFLDSLGVDSTNKIILHIGDVLSLSASLGIPVVYDNLHNKVNACDPSKDDFYWVSQCKSTWIVHYSQQDPLKNAGSHSQSIGIEEFLDFYDGLGNSKPDIMLEVKDKNLSAVKCINCTLTY